MVQIFCQWLLDTFVHKIQSLLYTLHANDITYSKTNLCFAGSWRDSTTSDRYVKTIMRESLKPKVHLYVLLSHTLTSY